MIRTIKAILMATALLFVATAHAAEPSQKSSGATAFTVNGTSVPQSLFDTILNATIAQSHVEDSPELRNAIKERLIRAQLLVKEAEKMGLDKKSEVAGQLVMIRQEILIRAYLQEYIKTLQVSDAMLQAEYENVLKALVGEKEYKARHVLVESEDEAKAIITKLATGAKLENLAKDSKDTGSKERGGDLGWVTKASLVKPFADAMAALEKGKYTQAPVKTDFGWHVILLEDTRDIQPPTFDQVKPQLTQRLQGQMLEKYIETMRQKAKVQ
jgi:peptidyl-prolyl cis-trans isomerase C